MRRSVHIITMGCTQPPRVQCAHTSNILGVHTASSVFVDQAVCMSPIMMVVVAASFKYNPTKMNSKKELLYNQYQYVQLYILSKHHRRHTGTIGPKAG